MPIIRMNAAFKQIKQATLSRQILALTGRLETLATAKAPAPRHTHRQPGLERLTLPEVPT